MPAIRQRQSLHYTFAVLGIAGVTVILNVAQSQVNLTTVALTLLLTVLFTAALWGSGPALLASIAGMLCFSFFSLPPVDAFTVADPDKWVALAAFLITAVIAGQLSARAKRQAEEAVRGQSQIEQLYQELRGAFEHASHTEALRQSERLKSALLDAVTHDLRTPLTSIKASVTTLLNNDSETSEAIRMDAEGQQELLEVINEETDRLNRFIQSMVELARIEAGEMHLRRSWGGVEEIIGAALARAEPLVQRHRIEIAVEPDLPLVRVDASALAEVVYTLVDNATKYAPSGTYIRVTANRAPDEMILITVEDEGQGIAVEMRERVFDKFFRATDAVRDDLYRPTGIGMGLAIARGIVEAHGGRIWIEDGERGSGTRFRFTTPIGDEDPPLERVEKHGAAFAANGRISPLQSAG